MPADSKLVDELVALTRQAGKIAQDSRANLKRELKPDGSIVSSGDKLVEEFLRPRLEALVPGTGVYGEEFGNDGPGPNGMWAVDPVDGTSNFVYGSPLWGVSVALIQEGQLAAGTVFLADLNEMYAAQKGGGASCNGVPLKAVPGGPILPTELLSYNDNLLRAHPGQTWPGKMRCSGAFVIDAMWVAQQRFRGLIGIRGKLYDVAASVLICQEAGAEVTYIDGSLFDVAELMSGITIPMPYTFLPKGAGPILGKA
jgi:myo-inositol-1(or 4)-monophosphatase